MIEKEKD